MLFNKALAIQLTNYLYYEVNKTKSVISIKYKEHGFNKRIKY